MLVVGIGVVLAAPTILRPLIQHVVRSNTDRAIDFGALRVRLGHRLGPRLEFDDLVIENTRWATSAEPFVKARTVNLDLTWSGLVSGRWVVERLELEDAAVDLERDAAGRRNSRLSRADGLGPPRAQVLSIDGRRTRLRIVDAITDFDIQLASTPLAAPRTLAGHVDLPLTRTIAFEGHHRGTAFAGSADVSDTLTLQGTGIAFALDGALRTDGGRVQVAGVVADLQRLGRLDADVRLAADPLSRLHPGLLPHLPALRDIAADAHVTRDGLRWSVTGLEARSRHAALSGSLDLHRAADGSDRQRLTVTLDASRLDVDEWLDARGHGAARAVVVKAAGPAAAAAAREQVAGAGSSNGMRPASGRHATGATRDADAATAGGAQGPTAGGASTVAAPTARGRETRGSAAPLAGAPARSPASVDPAAPAAPGTFDWAGLQRADGTFSLRIAELAAAKEVVVRDARLHATLEQGQLRVDVPEARLAGGRGKAELRLDAASQPATASLDAQLDGVRLRELPAAWATTRQQVDGGLLTATASVRVRGASVADWTSSASGGMTASLTGASVSNRLEAKLGLDGIAFLRAWLGGPSAVPLRCAELALDVHGGRATIRRLSLDTPRTAVDGRGAIDLVGRSVDVVLAPTSHVDALFALDRDIRLQGPLMKPKVSLQAPRAGAAASPCSAG